MPRAKQSAAVVRANGNRHKLTKAQLAEREASEVVVERKDVDAPPYLPAQLMGEYYGLAAMLARSDIICELDADALARYVIARANYAKAEQLFAEAAADDDAMAMKAATSVLDTYYRQCERTGHALGLDPSGRVGLATKREEPRANRFARFGGGEPPRAD